MDSSVTGEKSVFFTAELFELMFSRYKIKALGFNEKKRNAYSARS